MAQWCHVAGCAYVRGYSCDAGKKIKEIMDEYKEDFEWEFENLKYYFHQSDSWTCTENRKPVFGAGSLSIYGDAREHNELDCEEFIKAILNSLSREFEVRMASIIISDELKKTSKILTVEYNEVSSFRGTEHESYYDIVDKLKKKE